MQSIKEFGKDTKGPRSRLVQVRQDALNGRISEFTGLLGLLECGRVLQRIERRNLLVARFAAFLNASAYRVVRQREGRSADYKCVVVLLGAVKGKREELRSFASARGITFTGEVYWMPVHRMPAYAESSHPCPHVKMESSQQMPHLPVTDDLCANHVCPPLYPELTPEDVDQVCNVMNTFAREASLESQALLLYRAAEQFEVVGSMLRAGAPVHGIAGGPEAAAQTSAQLFGQSAALFQAALDADAEVAALDELTRYKAWEMLVLLPVMQGDESTAWRWFLRAQASGAAWRAPMQLPYGRMYHPRFTARPFWNCGDAPHLERLSLARGTVPEGQASLVSLTDSQNLVARGSWTQIKLAGDDPVSKNLVWREELCALGRPFARTCALLRGAEVASSITGTAKFYLMEPGTELKPHCGQGNLRLFVQLGVVVPSGVLLRVGDEERQWQEGRALILDDSFMHSVKHSGDAIAVAAGKSRMHRAAAHWTCYRLGFCEQPELRAGSPFVDLQVTSISSEQSESKVAVVAACHDCDLRVWSLQLEDEGCPGGSEPPAIRRLSGHRARLCSVDTQRHFALSGSADATARIWDLQQEAEVVALAHPESVLRTLFIPGSTLLATSCADASLRVWDVRASAERPVCLMASSYASCASIATAEGGLVAWAAQGAEVALFDIPRCGARRIATLQLPGEKASALQFVSSAKYLACGGADGSLAVVRLRDLSAELFDLQSQATDRQAVALLRYEPAQSLLAFAFQGSGWGYAELSESQPS
ncbi:unnamed protein product [Polarella glacialis]|uniref:Aspartyl/asparaginy/proline hydroxylase domain-containing protein n=1 Tax=Polarella glacialis TaxID=89957 RepID=A0A813FFM8_POLGL|nr:unnamed protein product [Polarella glacialis]